jgi:hypothetical protein
MTRPARSRAVRPERGLERGWLSAASLGFAAWISCQVYDPGLLTGPPSGIDGSPIGGSASFGGSGGMNVTGGKGSGAGSSGAGSSGDSSGATGGNSGGGTGGGANGGASGKSSAGAPSGGSAGNGSAGSAGNDGGSGTSGGAGEGGEGGAPDCMALGDCCPEDPDKTDPGLCDCGTPDTDTDGDETPDCDDLCPMDDSRTSPGECGCGATRAEVDCAALKSALIHRYSFEGTGTTITDSKGDLDGTVEGTGAMLSGTGTLALAGGVAPANDANKQHVDFGDGCLEGLEDATFEAWLTWSDRCSGSGCTNALEWQRIFDFGGAATNTAGAYIFLTPRSGWTGNPILAAQTTAGADNEVATGFHAPSASALVAGAHHFALVIDDAANEARLYVDGALAGSGAYAASAALAELEVSGCFLGRSHYSADPYLNGTFDEFRIYDAALPESAVALSFSEGPNPPFL